MPEVNLSTTKFCNLMSDHQHFKYLAFLMGRMHKLRNSLIKVLTRESLRKGNPSFVHSAQYVSRLHVALVMAGELLRSDACGNLAD